MLSLFHTRQDGQTQLTGPGVHHLSRCGLILVIAVGVALTACSETITNHGHQFQENDIQQVSPGMSQEQVKTTLGTPTTTASVGSGSAYYYISSTHGQKSFFKPVEKDRKVLAVYFSPMGSVDRVSQYGLKDGKVFDYVSSRRRRRRATRAS
jgi:outer membrane protein assembly factor BamE (lipoprotein component of BamABCDE complex)